MIRLAWQLAWRDLRGGAHGLLIVLLCLSVGVASVAGIGSLRAALDAGITQSSRGILGGDLALSTGLGPFPPAVRAWFLQRGALVTETVDTRSILVAPSGRRLLAAARAVGPGWPLLGQVTTAPPGQFSGLARGADGKSGLLLDATAARSLALHPGDLVTLGGVDLVFRGVILDSPDSVGDSQLFGVKAFVAQAALDGTPVLQPGGLVMFNMQIALPPGLTSAQARAEFGRKFPQNPWRWRDTADAAPDLHNFVDQAALFMTLLGLAALLVGGIGVANGVEAWMAGRVRTIATLRCLGASARLIGLIHALQLALLGVPGILAGVVLGGVAPWAILPLLRGRLPLPAHPVLYPAPLLLAAIFGGLVGLMFAVRPLQRAATISGAALFRALALPPRVEFSWRIAAVQGIGMAVFMALAAYSAPRPYLVLGFCVGTVITLLLLRGIAALLMRVLPWLPEPRDAARAFGLRRLYGPASGLPLMLLSAGAGLTVLVAVAEIRGNLLAAFGDAVPANAPSFFFIDIQPDDLPKFQAALARTKAAHDVTIMPSLRARILAVAGVPVESFHPTPRSAWPLRSDIAFTYAVAAPGGGDLAAGSWWAPDYLGPPLVSLDANIARGWHVHVGDRLTVSVLGRRFDLQIANLRDVDWQSLKLNFVMIGTPDPFAGAPHTLIATVKTDPGREGDVLAAVTDALPAVTGIDVSQVLRSLGALLGQIAAAVGLVGVIALVAGGLVLVSAVAAERNARIAEAVVLKTLGASRAQILRMWLTEFAVAGAAAGTAAAVLGTIAAAFAVTQVFHIGWHFEFWVLILTIGITIALMMLLGFAATFSTLRQPAAARLRQETGL